MKLSIYLLLLYYAVLLSGPVLSQNLLDPKTQPQFVNALPVPFVIDARSGGTFTISISQFYQDLGLVDPATGKSMLTKVWGYNGSYPGPTILARKNTPIDVQWQNNLVENGNLLPHLFMVDPSIHWAFSGRKNWQSYGIPVVTHLHGGHTESESDGLPDAWFTPGFSLTGKDFVKKTVHYSNDQEAATIWYHDHALGITRLNVYAGLAGYYLITDNNESNLQANNQLPAAPYDIGLAIQDRLFTTDGQLYYSTMMEGSGTPENSIMPEFFGSVILVNGKAWPVLEVEPRQYRFRLLNGSDSRFYQLSLPGNLKFTQIGSDNGLLPQPVNLLKVLLGTGERKDVIIDFSDPALWGKTIVLENNAKTPYPKGVAVDPKTTGRIMAFKVTKPFNSVFPLTVLPSSLRLPIVPLQTNLPARKLILFESSDEYGRLMPLLGTAEEGVKEYDMPLSERIQQGSTEIWEIYNETPDAHPIHLHMVHMQLVNRQKFSASIDIENGKPSGIRFQGSPQLPAPDEAGWKDTYISYPGEVLRVIANFDLAGTYVWHCHILSHEDHEMMRPYVVEPMAMPLTTMAVSKPEPAPEINYSPNPFSDVLTIHIRIKEASLVTITVYDGNGTIVKSVYSGVADAGNKQFQIDGSNWSSGTYWVEVTSNNQRNNYKLVHIK